MAGILVVAPAQPASAYCDGVGDGRWWSVGWAYEDTYNGLDTTCDGLGDYLGAVADWRDGDGQCVDLYRKDDIGSPWYFEQRSCTFAVFEDFQYNYADENAYFRTCQHASGTCAQQKYNFGF